MTAPGAVDPRADQYERLRDAGLSHEQALARIQQQGDGWGHTAADAYERARDLGLDDVAARGVVQHVFPPEPPTAPTIEVPPLRPTAPTEPAAQRPSFRAPDLPRVVRQRLGIPVPDDGVELDVPETVARAGRFARGLAGGAAGAAAVTAAGAPGALAASLMAVDVPGSPLAQSFPTSRGAPPVAGFGPRQAPSAAPEGGVRDVAAVGMARRLLERDPEELGGAAGMVLGGEVGARVLPAAWRAAVLRAQILTAGKAVAPRAMFGAGDPLAAASSGDPFRTLGLERATATPEAVDAAWREQATRWHPDRNPDPRAGEITSLLNAARDAAKDDLAGRPRPATPRPAAPARPAPEPEPRVVVRTGEEPPAPPPPEEAVPDFLRGERTGVEPPPRDVVGEVQAQRQEAPREPVPAATPSWEPPQGIVSLNVGDIERAPEIMQYKDLGPQGVSGRLRDTDVFNPDFAGVLTVWRDPESGQVLVVNGHHRHELAERSGYEGPLNVRFLNVGTAAEARLAGALENIADDKGTDLDAAKVFRETGLTREALRARGVSMRGEVGRRGSNLAQLAPEVFAEVATGKLSAPAGSAIGEVLPDNPEQQRTASRLVQAERGRLTEGDVREVAAQVRDAGSETVRQETLFGTEDAAVSLFVPRAKLVNALRGRLLRDRSLFGRAAENAGKLESVGATHIDAEAARAHAETQGQVEEVLRRLYTRGGPIAELVTGGARRIVGGEKTGAVASAIYPELVAAVQRELDAGAGGERGAGGGAGAEGQGGTAEAGAPEHPEGVVPDSTDPDQSGLFSFNDPLQADVFGGPPAEPEQGGLFGERAGTAAARTLSQTESAMRSELESLRQRFALETNPKRRAFLAREIAERERLVNRGQKISAGELQTRLAAGEGEKAFEPPVAATEAPSKAATPPRASSAPGVTSGVSSAALPPAASAIPSPALAAELSTLAQAKDSLLRALAPHLRGAEAKLTANLLRTHLAQMRLDLARADAALNKAARAFDGASREQIVDFMRTVQGGGTVADAKMAAAAKVASDILDHWAGAVEALGPGHINRWIDHYWAQLWKNPGAVQRWLAQQPRRPIEGRKGFKKHRVFMTFEDGLNAGFQPATWNPIDWMQAKIHELRKYIFGQRLVADLKKHNLITFVSSLERTPPGLVRVNDAAFQVWGPPETDVWEGFDVLVREGLQRVLASLRTQHARETNIGGRRMGYAVGDQKIVSRFGGPDAIVMHELGHILDVRYGLWDELVPPPPTKLEKIVDSVLASGKKASRKAIQAENQRIRAERKRKIEERKAVLTELRALADLRYEGIDPDDMPESFKKYVRERPEQIANAVHALMYAPERMAATAPTVKARLTAFLQKNPKLRPILDIKPSLVMSGATAKQRLEGFVKRGEWMVPEQIAPVLNNHLMPGLGHNPIYRGVRMATGAVMQSILSVSAFHFSNVGNDGAGSTWGAAIKALASGQPEQAARDILRGPLAPVRMVLQGHKLLRAAMDPKAPESAEYWPIIDAVTRGGANLLERRKDAIDGFLRAIRAARTDPTLRERAAHWGKASALSPFALLELTSYPLMNWYVPHMKAGLLFDMASREMANHPDLTADEVAERMSHIVDAVDNRFGQLSRDNLHWNRVVNDLVTILGTAPGWFIGGARAAVGGAVDLGRYGYKKARGEEAEMGWKGSYLLGSAAWLAASCITLTYLLTGEGPHEFKDYYTIRDGTKNPDGTPHRITPPIYFARDLIQAVHDPVQFASHKVNAFWTTVAGALKNRDYRGRMIVNPDDPLWKQGEQAAGYLRRQVAPMSLRPDVGDAGGPGSTVARFFGYRSSPQWVQRTAAENMAREYLTRRGSTALTPEQAEATDEGRDLLRRIRAGDAEAQAELGRKLATGEITPRQWSNVQRAVDEPPELAWFRPLTYEEAQRVFAAATPEQQAVLRPYLDQKRASAGGHRTGAPRVRRPRP